jgi:CxC2 like cysteine cluster associated with KDZ transposases
MSFFVWREEVRRRTNLAQIAGLLCQQYGATIAMGERWSAALVL